MVVPISSTARAHFPNLGEYREGLPTGLSRPTVYLPRTEMYKGTHLPEGKIRLCLQIWTSVLSWHRLISTAGGSCLRHWVSILCIGSVYAWSLFNPVLTKRLGVVFGAAEDWSLSEVVWIFTVAIVCLGLAAACAGKWLEDTGPRKIGVISAVCWGDGFLMVGLGIVFGRLGLFVFRLCGIVGGAVGSGLSLCFSCQYAHSLVPGPPKDGHGFGYYGLWWR